MDTGRFKTVKYPATLDHKFDKIALKLGRTRRLLFVQMVDYFFKSKKDPADINDELLKNALIKNHDTYTSFIKTQEKVLLIPMKADMERMIKNQEQIVKFFNTQVLKANKEVLAILQSPDSKMKARNLLTNEQSIGGESKGKIKGQFLALFGNYVDARDKLGVFKSKEKEELEDLFKKQVAEL